MTASKTSPAAADLDVIVPGPAGVIDVDGIKARVKRLKSREFLGLIRVLTLGLGPNIASFNLSGEREEVEGQVVAMFIMAIPEAIDEFGQFLFSVVEPVERADGNALQEAMKNPDVDVLLDIVTVIAEQEVDDFRSLVGKAKAALMRIQSVYRPIGK